MLGSQVARLRLLRAVGTFALLTGCTLDWAVRPDPPFVDGGVDAGPDTVAPSDANAPADATVTDSDATPSVDCAALRSKVDTARKTARTCTLTIGECQQTVKNECDCDVVIRQVGSSQATAYVNAVRELLDSGCPTGCTGALCPSTTGRNCLQNPSGPECYP
jgi:hypothetical protein